MTKTIRPENDIERLTNQQMVLLTFLIATIAAIASAIAVIRFYERNPQVVTKIINKKEIVQQTIEKTIENTPEVKVNRTVVIKESDLVAKAITANINNLYDVVLINEDQEMKVSIAFKKDNIIFVTPFDFSSQDRIFINDIEIKKVSEKNGIFLFEEVDEKKLSNISSEIAIPKLGTTIVNLFSSTHAEKSEISQIVDENIFNQGINSAKVSLVVNLSGKIVGVGYKGKVYSFNHFKN